MTPSALAQDLADIAADKLERLAQDIGAERVALDALRSTRSTYTQPLATEADRAALAVRDSRVQAASALDRLALSFRGSGALAEMAERQSRAVLGEVAASALRTWAAAWRAFAAGEQAQPGTVGGAA